MRYHHRLLAGCSLALITTAAMSGPLRAEDSSGVQETVTVNAYRAANSIGASTKTDTPVLETPQSVSVITREEMDARGVQNLNEALRYDAGILTESQGGDSRVDDFYIRGFDDGSWGDNLILDGMRLPPGSKWNRTKFDSWDMERVEVLKGPSAVLYGQVSPGGVVNQVSKTPVDNQMQQLRLSIDAYGKYQSAVDVGTSATDDGSVKLRLVGLYSNG
ncbi:MAG: TonB-dependent receptor plug domain-containing protein, partial [Rhizomicrobium sp.]